MAGGATGFVLDDLLDRRALPRRRVPIADHTRISHSVFERSRGLEYRFVPDGPLVTENEWQACLEALERIDARYLVLSGSLPRGVSDEFYCLVGEIAARGAPGSGSMPLEKPCAAVARGGLNWSSRVSENSGSWSARARERLGPEIRGVRIVHFGAVRLLAVTTGGDGALLATKDGVLRLKPPDMTVMIAVGAGESFAGTMTLRWIKEPRPKTRLHMAWRPGPRRRRGAAPSCEARQTWSGSCSNPATGPRAQKPRLKRPSNRPLRRRPWFKPLHGPKGLSTPTRRGRSELIRQPTWSSLAQSVSATWERWAARTPLLAR